MDMTAKAIQQYDEIAEEYAKNIAQRDPSDKIVFFEKYVPKGSYILDAGCAAGRDTCLLFEKGYKVIGSDLSKKLLEIAKKENPSIEFVLADIRKLPFEDETFDAVWATAIIHHLEKNEISKALQEFYRVIKPHGFVFITTKLGKGKWRIREEISQNKEREFTLLSTKELERMLEKAGFTKKEVMETKSRDRDVYWIQAIYQK